MERFHARAEGLSTVTRPNVCAGLLGSGDAVVFGREHSGVHLGELSAQEEARSVQRRNNEETATELSVRPPLRRNGQGTATCHLWQLHDLCMTQQTEGPLVGGSRVERSLAANRRSRVGSALEDSAEDFTQEVWYLFV